MAETANHLAYPSTSQDDTAEGRHHHVQSDPARHGGAGQNGRGGETDLGLI